MSNHSDIEYRINLIENDKLELTAVERSRKLKSLQVTSSKLKNRITLLTSQKKQVEKELTEAVRQLGVVFSETERLEKIQSPIVTEHALLRYVERFMGVDLEKAHAEILALSEDEVVKERNTIITCFTDPEDHFNLAERESV